MPSMRLGVDTTDHTVPFQCSASVDVPATLPTTQTSFEAIAVTASPNLDPAMSGGETKLQLVPFQCSKRTALKRLLPKKPTAHRSFGPTPPMAVSSSEVPNPVCGFGLGT